VNQIELDRALRQLRLSDMAAVLETRFRQAQAEAMTPLALVSCLVSDELTRRGERLLERRRKQAQFRDPQKTPDNFDFDFNKKMNRSLVFDLPTGSFIAKQITACFSVQRAAGKVIWPRPLGKPPFNRATVCCTGKLRSYSRNLPRHHRWHTQRMCGVIGFGASAHHR